MSRSDDAPRLAVQGLEVVYRGGFGTVRAVDGVDLEVRAGEIVALVGESGSGKSSLARALMGLVSASAGSISICGRPLESYRRRTLYDRVQMVFQDPGGSLDPRWTVERLVSDWLRVRGQGRRQARERTVAMLEAVGLDPAAVLDRRPHQLSGGQRQRVAIARALAVEPAVLLADEPVSALDLSTRARILRRLDDLRRQRQLAILWITHDLELVGTLCDRVVVLHRGRAVETLGGAELGQARHPETRALLASIPGHRPGSDRNRLLA